MINYEYKYNFYKKKYLELKNMIGGSKIVDTNNNHVTQPKSMFINMGIRAEKIPIIGSKISNIATEHCKKYREPDNAIERIREFAANFKIEPKTIEICQDVKTPDECWSKFRTPNDFFIRKRVGVPNHPSLYSIVSPADCYSIFLPEAEKSNVWIKGTNFTPQKLMDKNISFANNSLFIFRLAPQHYHGYHCPVSGRVLSIKKLGKEKYSVDPIIVKSSIDVFSENVRVVIEIELYNRKAYLAIIGATCVASVELLNPSILHGYHTKYNNTNKLTDEEISAYQNGLDFSDMNVMINTNEILGNFQYGGSTLVLIYPNENMKLIDIGIIINKNSSQLKCDSDIVHFFKKLFSFIYTFDPKCKIKPIETEIKVGDNLVNYNAL